MTIPRRAVVVKAAPAPAPPRPRGDVRELILRSATRLLAAHGFEGTTLQAVADEVGIRKPSVLHHFPSKEALRLGVIDEMLAHWAGVLPGILHRAGASTDRFDALTRELVRFFADDPDRARLLVRETLDRPREMRRLFRERVQPWITLLADAIREGQARGTFDERLDPELFLVHVLQLIVVGIAARGVFSPPGPKPPSAAPPGASASAGGSVDREIHELIRIARTSLFTVAAKAPRTTSNRS